MNLVSNFEPSHSQRMKTKITRTLKPWLVDRIPHLKSKKTDQLQFSSEVKKNTVYTYIYMWYITPKKWRLWVPMVAGTLALFLTLKNPFSNKKKRWRGAIRPKRTHIFHLPTGLILRGKLLVFTGWHMFHQDHFYWAIYYQSFSEFKAIFRRIPSLFTTIHYLFFECFFQTLAMSNPPWVNVKFSLAFWGRTSVSTHTTVHLTCGTRGSKHWTSYASLAAC